MFLAVYARYGILTNGQCVGLILRSALGALGVSVSGKSLALRKDLTVLSTLSLHPAL